MTSQATNQMAMVIGRNIAHARKEAGLSQMAVGHKLGMDSRGVSRWERGRVAPSTGKLMALADLFERDPGWFYTDHERKAA